MWEIECTGDYGLSDCLSITEEAWDFAEMAWKYPEPSKSEAVPSNDEPRGYDRTDWDEDDFLF